MSRTIFYCKGPFLLAVLLAGILFLEGCGGPTPPPAASLPPPSTETAAALIPTTFQPSPTAAPAAAQVNGEAITLEAYQAELARYASAIGSEPGPDEQQAVLDDLINQTLLAQAAVENGFAASEAEIRTRYETLAQQAGGSEALTQWLSENGYTEETFRQDLKRAAAAAWMRDRITAQVPEAAEQVHAQQILAPTREEAEQVLARLASGVGFGTIAAEYDPVAEGELGWFPRGYLLYPEIEEAAFALQPGETSPVVETEIGFHVIRVIERAERPLTPDAKLALQENALQTWLDERRQASDISVE